MIQNRQYRSPAALTVPHQLHFNPWYPGTSPWYQHMLANGAVVDEAQQGNFYVPGHEAVGSTSSEVISEVMPVVTVASTALSVYHGYRRNQSIGWALWWGFMGAVFPVVTPAIAVAQGFGERKK